MITASPQRGGDIKPRRTAIRWVLFLTLVHTVPVPWFFFIVAGLAPTSVILAVGLVGTFWITEGTPSMVLMALAPAVLYCLVQFGVAHLLALLMARVPNRRLRTGLVLLTVAALLIAAFQPIYWFAGHSGTDFGSIADFWPLTRLPQELFHAYTTAFILLLVVLLVRLYWGRPLYRFGFRYLWGSLAVKSATLACSLLLVGVFLFVNHVLLICRPLAELGVVRAQMCMGRAMLGVDPNDLWGENDARTWFERAAGQGDAEAAWELFRLGGDVAQRLRWLGTAAENGSREAQYELYRRLSGSKRSLEERKSALRWLRAAAENGDARAQYDLAALFRWGAKDSGIPKDLDKARHWLERAAEQGHPDALWEVADQSEQGSQRFPLDLERARRLFRKYAESAESDGSQTRKGVAALRDAASRIAAIDDLQRGVERGEPGALRRLAARHLEAHEPASDTREHGMELLGRAAGQGDLEAEYERGSIYMFGRYDVPKDEARGRASWSRAAEGHYPRAMERVADGLIRGQYGYEVDYLTARELVLSLIAAHGEGLYGENLDSDRKGRWEGELAYIERAVERAGGVYEPAARLREQAAENDARAQYQLARQLFAENQIKHGPEWLDLYKKAAANGQVDAQMKLFGLFRRGLSYTSTADPGAPPRVIVPNDQDQALHYLEQAAGGRHPQAMAELALAYYKGRFGLDKDLARARELYREIIHAIDNDLHGWEVDERFVAMQRAQLGYTERALRHAQERQRRYENATDIERRIMAVEDKYQQEYQRRANAVCRGRTHCTREQMQEQRRRIRLEISLDREREIAELKRNAPIAD